MTVTLKTVGQTYQTRKRHNSHDISQEPPRRRVPSPNSLALKRNFRENFHAEFSGKEFTKYLLDFDITFEYVLNGHRFFELLLMTNV